MKDNLVVYDEKYYDDQESMNWKRRRRDLGKYEKQFLEALSPLKEDLVLDAGCGVGWHIYHYSEKCKFVVGVDLGIIGLKRAAKRLKEHGSYYNVSLVLGTVERLPFANNYFDRILCVNVIEHLEHPSTLLREACRILRKNGLFILSTHNAWDPVMRTLEFISHLTNRKVPLIGYPDKTHKHRFSIPELKTILKEQNFRVLDIKVQYSLFLLKTFGGDLVITAQKR